MLWPPPQALGLTAGLRPSREGEAPPFGAGVTAQRAPGWPQWTLSGELDASSASSWYLGLLLTQGPRATQRSRIRALPMGRG